MLEQAYASKRFILGEAQRLSSSNLSRVIGINRLDSVSRRKNARAHVLLLLLLLLLLLHVYARPPEITKQALRNKLLPVVRRFTDRTLGVKPRFERITRLDGKQRVANGRFHRWPIRQKRASLFSLDIRRSIERHKILTPLTKNRSRKSDQHRGINPRLSPRFDSMI